MMEKTRNSNGFSLIELMIALVLGLLLSTGIVTVFTGSKQSSELNIALADMQESARFALNQLSSDIRMSGYQGCKDISRGSTNILALDAPTEDLEKTFASGSVVTTQANWTPTPPIAIASLANVIAGTHALTLQFGSEATFPLAENVGGNTPNRSDPIAVDTTSGISSEPFNITTGDFAIISNCAGADLIKVTNVAGGSVEHTNGGNISDSLSFDYFADKNTKFMRFNSNIYFVGDTGSTSSDGNIITGLYQQKLPYDANNPPVLMISGVENMRILFGVRTDSETVSFLTPDNVVSPEDIETVRIGLLMVSDELINDQIDERTYTLAGQPIVATTAVGGNANTHPSDRRYRQAFNTTVNIRNRRNIYN